MRRFSSHIDQLRFCSAPLNPISSRCLAHWTNTGHHHTSIDDGVSSSANDRHRPIHILCQHANGHRLLGNNDALPIRLRFDHARTNPRVGTLAMAFVDLLYGIDVPFAIGSCRIGGAKPKNIRHREDSGPEVGCGNLLAIDHTRDGLESVGGPALRSSAAVWDYPLV